MKRGAELIIGVDKLTRKFGRVPSFHDAEVLRVELIRDPIVLLRVEIYTFSVRSDLDSAGNYAVEDECIVTLSFSDPTDLILTDFNQQNVLSSLSWTETDGRVKVDMRGIYGMSASFDCTALEVLDIADASNASSKS